MDINYIALTREATQVSALTTRFVLLREEILDLEHARAFDFIFVPFWLHHGNGFGKT